MVVDLLNLVCFYKAFINKWQQKSYCVCIILEVISKVVLFCFIMLRNSSICFLVHGTLLLGLGLVEVKRPWGGLPRCVFSPASSCAHHSLGRRRSQLEAVAHTFLKCLVLVPRLPVWLPAEAHPG